MDDDVTDPKPDIQFLFSVWKQGHWNLSIIFRNSTLNSLRIQRCSLPDMQHYL
jgi:hypothetical protein